MSPFIVIYDANVLYPSLLRDLLIRIAQEGLVQAKWTDQILDEAFRNIRIDRPGLDESRLDRTRVLMNNSVRDCLVTQYEPLICALSLPDEGDRHVLAAAIKSRAQLIVTNNLDDFPADRLAPWGIEAVAADDFIHDIIDLDKALVLHILDEISRSYKRPPLTVDEILDRLDEASPRLTNSVAALRS